MRDPEPRRLTSGRSLAGLVVLAVSASSLILGFDARQGAAMALGRLAAEGSDEAGLGEGRSPR